MWVYEKKIGKIWNGVKRCRKPEDFRRQMEKAPRNSQNKKGAVTYINSEIDNSEPYIYGIYFMN